MVTRRTLLTAVGALPVAGAVHRAFGQPAVAPTIWQQGRTRAVAPVDGDARETAGRIQSEIDRVAAEGGGTVALNAAVFEIDRPLVVPAGVSVLGPGKRDCLIRNTHVPDGKRYDFYRNALFMPGNFHPAYTQGLFGDAGSVAIRSARAGDAAVTLATSDAASEFQPDDLVILFDSAFYRTVFRVFRYLALRRVVRLDGGTLHLDEPLRDRIDGGSVYALRTGNIAGHGPLPHTRLRLFAWGNGEIGGFSADTPGTMIADSAVYKGRFVDIELLRSRSIWYGNCYQHCLWDGVGGRFMVGAGELSHNSEATEVRNFAARYDAVAAAEAGAAFSSGISVQENALDMTYRDGSIDITGAAKGNAVQIINAQGTRISAVSMRNTGAAYAGNVVSIANQGAAGRRAACDNAVSVDWSGPCGRYVMVQGPDTEGNTIGGSFAGPVASGEAFRMPAQARRNAIAPGTHFASGKGRMMPSPAPSARPEQPERPR